MAGVVVFCTTYALILPAITMEQDVFCGLEEHVHTEACFQETVQKNLVCTPEQLLVHTHADECYDQEGALICGQADYVAHSHDALCYDGEGQLVCTLAERTAHVHGDSCYQLPTVTVEHVHQDSCYEKEQGELLCGITETEGHAHGGECYRAGDELLCTTPVNHVHAGDCFRYPLVCTLSTEPHSHGNGCYAPGTELQCSIPEGHVHSDSCRVVTLSCTNEEEGHTHGDECYSSSLVCSIPENHAHAESCYKPELVCTLDTTTAHSHGPECYSTVPETVCEIVENHVHGDACYNQVLQCQLEEVEPHAHIYACYQWNDVLICSMEEGDPEIIVPEDAEPELICREPVAEVHVHGEACFETAELPHCTEDHTHTAECEGYDCICGLEAHEHSLPCYSDPEADVETAAVWEATLSQVTLTGDARADLVAIAKTQLGYAESSRNYAVWEDNTTHGYTRYGAWYGSPYGDWCAMFVSFCLHYADVDGVPLHWGCRPWIEELTALNLYHRAEEYTPQAGDIIFYDWEGDELSDHVGIVAEVIPNAQTGGSTVRAIEGNSANCVQYVDYAMDDARILGYGVIPVPEEEPVTTYYCGREEHIHEESCFNEEGTQICGLEEHFHNALCTITPERQGRIQEVVSLINALPASDEIQQTLLSFDNSGDTAGYEAYFRQISSRALGTYVFYEDLAEAERQAVSNRDKLLSLQWLWSAKTLELIQEIPVYQINSYDQKDSDAGSGSLLLYGCSADDLGADQMGFRYWYAIIVEENEKGLLYVDRLVTELSETADKSALKASTANGFVLLVYKDNVASLDVETGNYVSVPFDYTQTAAYTGTSYGAITFTDTIYSTLSVEKALSADDETMLPLLGNPDFRFQVLKADAENAGTEELFIGADVEYTIFDGDDQMIGTGITDENGVFAIKAGQRAEFAEIAENGGSYYVRELFRSVDFGQYETVTVNGVPAAPVLEITLGDDSLSGFDSDIHDAAGGDAAFLFDNRITCSKLGTLAVTKTLEKLDGSTDTESVFTILVEVDGNLLPVGTTYTVAEEERTVSAAGEIGIKAGETALISKIISGSGFRIWEKESSVGDYIVSYTGSSGVTGGAASAFGTVHTEEALEINVHNAEVGTSIDIPVTKTLSVSDGAPHTFTFTLEQVTDASGAELLENGVSLTAEIQVTDQTTADDAFTLNYYQNQIEASETFYYRVTETAAETAAEDSAEAAEEPAEETEEVTEEPAPQYSSVIYDPAEYILAVTVEKAEDGTLAEPTAVILRDEAQVEAITFTNTLTGQLNLRKVVKGVDTGLDFGFILQQAPGTSGLESLPTTYPVTVRLADGSTQELTLELPENEATLTLKNGDAVMIHGVPIGAQWTITEGTAEKAEDGSVTVTSAHPTGFAVTVTVETIGEEGEILDEIFAGNIIDCEIETGETDVIFTNTSTYALPKTGGAGTIPYTLAGIMLMLFSAAFLLYNTKKCRREVE